MNSQRTGSRSGRASAPETARIVWKDMQLGPSGTARPDVYALPCSFSKFCPVVYEIKISVSDFRADVTAGKFTKYFECRSLTAYLKKNEVQTSIRQILALTDEGAAIWQRTGELMKSTVWCS